MFGVKEKKEEEKDEGDGWGLGCGKRETDGWRSGQREGEKEEVLRVHIH